MHTPQPHLGGLVLSLNSAQTCLPFLNPQTPPTPAPPSALLCRSLPPFAVLGVVTQGGKVWADRYQRRLRAKAGQGQLARALSLRSGAKLELTKFAAGSSAPFPLLHPSPTHAAQHLLLDVRLPPAAAPPAAASGTGAGAEGRAGASAATGSASDEAVGLPAMAELMQAALAGAGLRLQRGQPLGAAGHMPSSGSGEGSYLESDSEQQQDSESVLLACQDGYAALVWHASARSLSGGWQQGRAQEKAGAGQLHEQGGHATSAAVSCCSALLCCPLLRCAAFCWGRAPCNTVLGVL